MKNAIKHFGAVLSGAMLFSATVSAQTVTPTPVFVGYMALGTSPTVGFMEETGGGYARQPVTLTGLQGGAATSRVPAETFGPATGATWTTVTQAALYDAPTGGNLIAYWGLSSQQATAVGSTFSLPQETVTFSELTKTVNSAIVSQIPLGTVLGTIASSALGANTNGVNLVAGTSLSMAGGALSAATPSTYLGNIATSVGIPTFMTSGSNSFQTRTPHVSWDNVTSLALVIPNWYVYTGIGEGGTGGTMTLTASVEYPVGTFNQMTWIGSTSIVCANGATCTTDAKTLSVPIPKGAMFYTRIHALMSINSVPNRITGGTSISAYNYGANVADQTMGGTVPLLGFNPNYFTPAAVIAYTKIPSVLLIGDSRLAGYDDSSELGVNDVGNIEKGLARGVPIINEGVAGDYAGQYPMTLRASLAQYVTHVVSEYGINNLRAPNANQSLAQTEAALASVYALFPNKIIFQTTLEPNTTSTDNWLTVANQTVTAWESNRQAFNTQVRTYGMPGTNGSLDPAHCVETGGAYSGQTTTTQPQDNGGFWMADGTTQGKLSTDGLHPDTIANDKEAQYCIIPNRITR